MADSNDPQGQPQPPARNEKGQLLPGNTANPEGKNGYTDGWQPYGRRLQHWMEKQLVELKTLHDDPAQFDALSSIDAICIENVLEIFGEDKRRERKDALDRIEGTPRQTILHQGDEDAPMTFTLAIGKPLGDIADDDDSDGKGTA